MAESVVVAGPPALFSATCPPPVYAAAEAEPDAGVVCRVVCRVVIDEGATAGALTALCDQYGRRVVYDPARDRVDDYIVGGG